jgi:hypothetical protein
MRFLTTSLILIVLLNCSCVPHSRVVGTFGTDYGDTLRMIDDQSWKVELAEPDTTNHKQFKFTTGRWYKKRNKVELHVDSKSYGDYWECLPLKASWCRLKRNMECDRSGKNYVFDRVNYRKLRRIAKKEAKREIKREKKEEDEKMKKKLQELEAGGGK